jgi:hypothetical protein
MVKRMKTALDSFTKSDLANGFSHNGYIADISWNCNKRHRREDERIIGREAVGLPYSSFLPLRQAA